MIIKNDKIKFIIFDFIELYFNKLNFQFLVN